MKHLGDITKISGYDAPPVDCVIGGSPCQDLSLAGKRAGLAGERSGLFMEQIRIIKEMRKKDVARGRTGQYIRPRYMVWENVPGALSSGTPKGEDFRIVLEEVCKIVDESTVIPRPPKDRWRTSGVIVGDGFSVAWRVHDAQFWGVPQRRRRIALVADFGGQSAPEILFVRKSVFGCSAESGETRERTSEGIEGSVAERNRVFGFLGRVSASAGNIGFHEEISPFCITGSVASTLDASYYKGCGMRNGVEREIVFYSNEAYDKWKENDIGSTLRSTGGIYQGGSENICICKKTIRRLTPLECERLQGFPDHWTDIGDWTDSKGKKRKTTDSNRYKALGNSIALPFWKWLIKRISAQYERDATMASLFDGIGGFPLLWEQINGKGSCLWASEIEEFPIAVTKYHFGG